MLRTLRSVQFSCSVVSDSLWPYESQHARPPCPSPTPGVHSDSRPSSRRCHPAVSSSVLAATSVVVTMIVDLLNFSSSSYRFLLQRCQRCLWGSLLKSSSLPMPFPSPAFWEAPRAVPKRTQRDLMVWAGCRLGLSSVSKDSRVILRLSSVFSQFWKLTCLSLESCPVEEPLSEHRQLVLGTLPRVPFSGQASG